MYAGTYYLTNIDDKHRRFYAIKEGPQRESEVKSGSASVKEGGKVERRLATLNSHFSKESNQDLDSSVLRSVIVNFHKKPI